MSISMDEYIDKLNRIRSLDPSIPLGLAVADTIDKYYARIFVEGKNTSGGNIEYKSTNEVYINSQDGSPKKLSSKGKTGRDKFNDGRLHRSTYFKNYKAFKGTIGRPILELFGSLQSSIANGIRKTSEDTYELAVDSIQAEKIDGLQYGNGKWSGFGTIFKLSQDEKNLLYTTFTKQMIKQLSGD